MRQTRLKTNREYRGRSIGFIIVFVLILPIVAISLGYIGTKYFVIPNIISKQAPPPIKEQAQDHPEPSVSQENSNQTVESTQEAYASTFEIQGFTIYGVQMGSFSTADNAQALMENLKKQNFGSYLWQKDGFKVITAALMERREADSILSKVKAFDENAFVASTNIPMRAVKYNKEDAKYTLLLTNENRKLIEVFQQLSKQVFEEYNNPSLKNTEKIKEQLEKMKSIREELVRGAPTSDLSRLHAAYVEMLDQMIKGLDETLTLKDQGSVTKLQNTLTGSLYRYHDLATSDAY
ncbi:Sporulation related domain-containing protein [Geosporobacter subterraneus DSM 17957]|uniref:Sporulation related domain-containing protein n=1 Tax=Geosporobacter subterraneus DSM 17957 TaxID=1121919 RepID=A0A1M6HHY3_9FIRM|nr:SPOR domain-containing protein [Geosporobacter subterraneus]SHJ21856.1 Sporulation related domain-containing protein [Geosporobacter subterraneus DSM 17957]